MSEPTPIDMDLLISLYLDSDIEEADFRRLNAWLKEDRDHVAYFVNRVADHGRTSELVSGEFGLPFLTPEQESVFQNPSEAEGELPTIPLTAADRLTKQQYASALSYVLRHTFTPNRVAALATAAVLLLGVTLFFVFTGNDDANPSPELTAIPSDLLNEPGRIGPDNPTAPNIVATLTAELDAVWDRRPGRDLYTGQRLTLTQGFAEITTARGAVAILEAPATFELLDDDNAIHLHSGKLVGLCHTESSKGFVVKTEHADITDLGTEFGVTVQADRVEAGVFVGEIAVKVGAEPSNVVNKNQTVRVKLEDGQSTLAVLEERAQGYTRRIPRPAVVDSVRMINSGGMHAVVSPQAFYESALLYADRDYQALPSSDQGLPTALLGGDIVKTPVDLVKQPEYKRFEIELSVQHAANVFVLRPPGASVDGWLERDYINTGATVTISGLERESRACEVWQRKSPITGSATVAWGVAADAIGMYTLVVTPAETE